MRERKFKSIRVSYNIFIQFDACCEAYEGLEATDKLLEFIQDYVSFVQKKILKSSLAEKYAFLEGKSVM